MASKHIEIKGNETRFADRYRRFVDGLAALLGIESAAEAQTIYNLHVDMESKLDSGAVDAFVSRLG
jgi:hypothetical protein